MWLNLGTIVVAVILAVATAAGFGVALSKRADSPRAARPVPTEVAATSPSSQRAANAAIAPVATVLAAFDDRTVWVGRGGSCAKGGAQVSITHDGGLSWSKRTLPGAVRSLTRVHATGAEAAFIVGAGTDCQARMWGTGDAGSSWSDPQRPSETWARNPKGGATVVSPADPASPACPDSSVVDLDANTDAGVVLCANGQILTSGTGKSWAPRDQKPKAVAVAAGSGAVFAAEVNTSGCTGVRVSEVQMRAVTNTGDATSPPTTLRESDEVSGTTPSTPSCLTVEKVKAGSVALALVGKGGWLTVGNDLYRSDDLKRWDKAGTISAG